MQNAAFLPNEDMSDAALAALAAGGSSDAFDLLTRRLAPMMNSLSARYGNVLGLDEQDLLQEGLLGLFAAVHAYREDGGSFFSFAATCVRNRMLSLVRRHLPAGEFEAADAEEMLSSIPDMGQADPAALLIKQEDARRLYGRLRERLTPMEYRVLAAHLAEKSYKEIAKELAITEKAVDNALQRVRQKLSKDSFH